MFYFDTFLGKKVLRSDFLSDINAFFTTRDWENDIYENFEALNDEPCDYLKKLGINSVISPIQTHSDNIEIVDENFDYPNTDGLILKRNDVAINLKFADCTPLIIYDKKNNIVAISHAGWRGTAQKIGVKTVEKMQNSFETSINDIIVVIGPAISLCCYEVSEDVKNQLLSTVKNQEGLYKNNNVDLKSINARQFEEIGITQIDICPYCTSCNNDLFYSYRKENGTTNRHRAVAFLQPIQ